MGLKIAPCGTPKSIFSKSAYLSFLFSVIEVGRNKG